MLDPRRAERLGVREGQLTIQYHGGGGVLTGEIGRLFFRRKDYPRQIRAVNLALQSRSSTCASARSLAELRQRLSACTSPTAARRSRSTATRASG